MLVRIKQMTKQQLVEMISTQTERTKTEVETILDTILNEVSKALTAGERVDLRGFGSFTVKERKARPGRNPITGETITIAAKKAAIFKPGKELADRIAQPKSEPMPA